MTKHKKSEYPSWWAEKAPLGFLAGAGLTYVALIPLEAHGFHWIFTGVGAAVGFGVGLFLDRGIHSLASLFRRHPRKGASSAGQSKRREEKATR